MDALFIPLAEAVGASVDQIKLITCFLISYPLGSLYIRVPSSAPTLRHLFSIGISFFFLVAVLKLWTGFLQLLASVLATYYIALTMKGPNMPWVVFVYVHCTALFLLLLNCVPNSITMGHLTVNHLIRALFNLSYETVEITGPQMVLTMKLTTFAWNVWDGRRPAADLDKWQMEKRVTQFPTLIEFLGYAFYFPGLLVGPYSEYTSYLAVVNETSFITAKGKEKENTSGRRVPSGRKRIAYSKMTTGLLFLGAYVFLIGRFNFTVVLDDWFVTRSFLFRIAYFQICGILERSKYYAIWSLTEGASILTGLGFAGYDSSGKSLWTGAANVNIPLIEFAPNWKVLLDSWNIKTNVWLRECVYKRVTPPGKKAGFRSSMITFATSAFWHGIAGGYYLTFLFGGFVQTVARQCRASIRPLLLPADGSVPSKPTAIMRLYDLAGIVATNLILNFTAAPFMLLTINRSLQAWSRLNWYGVWMIGGGLLFFNFGGKGFLKGMQAKRVKGATTKAKAELMASGPNTPGAHTVPPIDLAVKEVKVKTESL